MSAAHLRAVAGQLRADLKGLSIAKDDVVELKLKGGEMEGNRYIVYWPSDNALHMLVSRRSGVGRT